MKVAIIGCYGYRNFGDDLIEKVLKTEFKDHEVDIIDLNHIQIKKDYDLIIVGGGGILLMGWWHFEELMKIDKTPIIFLGVGIEEVNVTEETLDNFRRLFAKKNVKEVYVRDNYSKKYLEENNVCDSTLIPDLTFLYNIPKVDKDFTIGLNSRVDYSEDFGQKALIEKFNSKEDIVFISCQDVDSDSVKKVGTIFKYEDVDNTINLISRCKKFYGMRLHSVIVAMIAGCDVEAFCYRQKVMEIMIQFGDRDREELVKEYKTTLEKVMCEVKNAGIKN